MDDLTLESLDADGALTEAIGNLHGSRADFLKGAVVGGAALLGLAATAPEADAFSRDVEILNFALVLEYLQADFYTEVERMDVLKGGLARQARIVGAHERAHVKSFKEVLGSKAVKKPKFDYKGATESSKRFRQTAVAFEDLAVAAYKGQAPRIRKSSYLVPALAIHAVEARHAAWIRRLAGISPVLTAFDEPKDQAATLKLVKETGFIQASKKTKTRSRRSPKYTG